MLSSNTKESANATLQEAKNTAYNAKRDLRDAKQEARHDISEMANNAGRQVRQFFDSASDQLSDANDRIVSEVRENPVRSSLIALGLGFVIGALVRR